MTRVVVAPDKFKGSLSAAAAAVAVETGLRAVVRGLDVIRIPVADGGDGTVDAAVAAGFARVPVTASGPTGEPVATSYARGGDVAVVELADVCGLARLPHGPAPLDATSRGLGEVVAAAVRDGARRVVVGLGGSASTDGGRGFLDALGEVDLHAVELIGATDVTNPLLGPSGAATVYGPQKGATPDQVETLEHRLRQWAERIAPQLADVPGAGAAGGVGFALLHLGAVLRPGIDVVLELADMDDALRDAALLVTGEGSLDAQTLHGKAVAGVAAAGRRNGVPAVAVVGRCSLDRGALDTLGISAVYPLDALEPDAARSIAQAGALVERAARTVAEDFLS